MGFVILDSLDERLARLRHRQLADHVDNLPDQSDAIIGWTGIVYDGGAIPNAGDRYYLLHPVSLNGSESEGDVASVVVDTSQSASVLVLNNPAAVGDLLVARGIGGRWVAERHGTSSSTYPCGACAIPKANLTVTYHNGVIGDGSTPLIYTAPSTWISACSNQLLYQILCVAGFIEFRVIYFISGSCPSGQSNYCSTLGGAPLGLTTDSLVCGSSFDMEVSVTSAGCPSLWNNGYTGFSITYP